eukprot:Blabericola_migrator_1__9928@NODE_548_length_7679_cov_28_102207_g414_i0_p2_GENE_NODE_548_length_7679_cov_28_102207_g414_i0NODE_548_length_7679_cov_28_102207_g414_i0_p2_ORF_typecomplete_len276_score41_06SH3_2/PF07653_17/0_12_NODE_548_length_7679_cov_28_102207_g414_i058886715
MCLPCYSKQSAYGSTCACGKPLSKVATAPQDERARPLFDLLFETLVKCAHCGKRTDLLQGHAEHVDVCIKMGNKRSVLPIDEAPKRSKQEKQRLCQRWKERYEALMEDLLENSAAGLEEDQTPNVVPRLKLYLSGRAVVRKAWTPSDVVPMAKIIELDQRLGPEVPRRPLPNYEESVSKLLFVEVGQSVDIVKHPQNSLYGWCLGHLAIPEENLYDIGWFPSRCILESGWTEASITWFFLMQTGDGYNGREEPRSSQDLDAFSDNWSDDSRDVVS